MSVTRRAFLAAPAVAAAARAAQAQQGPLVVIGTDGWLFPAWDRVASLDVNALRQTLTQLAEATTIIRNGRMDLVLCLIPSKKRLMRRFLPSGAPYAADIDRRYAMTLQEVRRAGALAPDLDARFREVIAREPHRQLYWKTDTHWTPVGAEVAAIEIARQMREQLGMPPSSRPGTALGDLRPMFNPPGDLVQYVPANARGSYRPEESLIRQVVQVDGPAALLEDDVSDVTIVGTSNMQPRFGFQAVLSNQLMRPVGLSWKTNNFGPYFVLLDYFRSEAFRRERPRAIVWNLLEIDMLNGPNSGAWGQSAMAGNSFLTELRRLVAR